MGLCLDVVRDELTVCWVDRNLARDEQELTGSHGLGIGTNGGSCAMATNGFHGWLISKPAWSGGLDDPIGSDAAGAHLDPLRATVDERPNRLDVGFKTSRGYVVGVAHVTSDRGPFSTHFAASCHGGNDDSDDEEPEVYYYPGTIRPDPGA